MNIIFFGSDRFAVPALSYVISSSHKVICAVTQPDRLKGRGLKLSCTEVKKIAEANKLRVYQPENVNSQESVKFLSELKPDILAVVAFGQILSKSVLEIPRITAINLHASLLPKYRGAAPINWAIIKGEKQTGVSIIKMTPKMDAGPVILQKSLDIGETDDTLTLEDKLSNLGADLLLEALNLIQADKFNLAAQNEKDATFAPKLKKEDALIDWNKSAHYVFNLIRGCAGWPGAFTYFQGKILKIHRAGIPEPEQHLELNKDLAALPGRVLGVSREGMLVATGYGKLLIEELQIEGKKKISVREFISGYKISVGEMLGIKSS
ncbi:MAG: methionyl-tRNA formyltransferase [Candidatus Omnitrophota bacterium]